MSARVRKESSEPSIELRFLESWMLPKLQRVLTAIDGCWKDSAHHVEWLNARAELLECIQRIDYLRKLARWCGP